MNNLKIDIYNFKSIEHSELNLKPGLNILIGPNGSGKTCLLSALKFLRDLIQLGAAQALAKGGGSRRVYHRRKKFIRFSMSSNYGQRTYKRLKWPCVFSWEITIAQRGVEKIASVVNEKARIDVNINGNLINLFEFNVDRSNLTKVKTHVNLCDSDEYGRDLFSFWTEAYREENKSNIYDKFMTSLNDLRSASKKNTDSSFFSNIAMLDVEIQKLQRKFQFLNEYNIAPDVARASTEQLQFAYMKPDGGSVSEVIYALENRHYHRIVEIKQFEKENMYRYRYGYKNWHFQPSFFQLQYYDMPTRRTKRGYPIEKALENINKELAAAVKPISSVGVQIDPTNGKRFVAFRVGQDTFYPEEVSDGTIKWLCILVSIYVPYSQVYILEEPENFLHPWMQQRLVNIMREQAQKENIIVLLASHSATILNAANPDEVLIIAQTTNGTKVREVKAKDEIEQVLKESDFRLGDLWVSGAIGGVPAGGS